MKRTLEWNPQKARKRRQKIGKKKRNIQIEEAMKSTVCVGMTAICLWTSHDSERTTGCYVELENTDWSLFQHYNLLLLPSNVINALISKIPALEHEESNHKSFQAKQVITISWHFDSVYNIIRSINNSVYSLLFNNHLPFTCLHIEMFYEPYL